MLSTLQPTTFSISVLLPAPFSASKQANIPAPRTASTRKQTLANPQPETCLDGPQPSEAPEHVTSQRPPGLGKADQSTRVLN